MNPSLLEGYLASVDVGDRVKDWKEFVNTNIEEVEEKDFVDTKVCTTDGVYTCPVLVSTRPVSLFSGD